MIRLAREIAAKAYREHARGKQSEIALAELPFKSLTAVEANDYQPVAYKANELDNTSIVTQGAEWVSTIWSNEIWERVRISNPVIANLVTFAMSANTFVMPVMSSDPTVYYTGVAANATALPSPAAPWRSPWNSRKMPSPR
jgi:hypothetical protein